MSKVKFIKNPKAKEHKGKYTLKPTMPKRDQFVLSYALLANSLRAKPSKNELQDEATFYEQKIKTYLKEVTRKVKGKDVKKTVKSKKKVWVKESMRRDKIKLYFTSLDALHKEAVETYPELMLEVVDVEFYGSKQQARLLEVLKEKKIRRLGITCAVGGAKVDLKAMSAMKTWKGVMEELGCPTLLGVLNVDNKFEQVDPALHTDEDFYVFFDDVKINENLYIDNIKMNPRQSNPLTGLEKFSTSHQSSVLVGHPKQRWSTIPKVEGLPRVKISTGSITKPNYSSPKYGKYRTDKLAEATHDMGFVIIELDENDLFHYRTVLFNKDGSFFDLGVLFKPSMTGKKDQYGDLVWSKRKTKLSSRAKFLGGKTGVLGDVHGASADTGYLKSAKDQLDFLDTEKVVLHDLIDSYSSSHHSDYKQCEKTALILADKKSLAKELEETASVVNDISNVGKIEEVLVTVSNHDDFISRALDLNSRWLTDDSNTFLFSLLHPANTLFKLKSMKECDSVHSSNLSKKKVFGIKEAKKTLEENFGKSFADYIEKNNPELLECHDPAYLALRMFGLNDKTRYLQPGEILKEKGIYLQFHGHNFFATAKTLSKVSSDNSKGISSISGHKHTSSMDIAGASKSLVVGACISAEASYYTLGGISTWLATNAFIYRDGSVQQLTTIGTKWRLEDGVYDKIKKLK